MGRSPCCDKNGLKKGPWASEEDDLLIQYIHTNGPGNWRTLPKIAGLQRCGKSCRLRWTNYLRPDIKRGRFSFEEEESIIQLHSVLGNKWSAIAARLPGRTDNEIKNYWNTHIRKRLFKMGIDPVTHSPRLDFLDLSSILRSNQLNYSSLLGFQTLLNPDFARLFITLLAPNHQNPNTLSQKMKENQITINTEMQNHLSSISKPNTQCVSSSLPTRPIINQTQGMGLMSCQNYQQNLVPSNTDGSFGVLPNNFSNLFDQIKLDLSKNPNFPTTNSSQVTYENVTFNSLLSMPSTSPNPLNSSTTFFNNNSTADEWDMYYSDVFKFEIPESLDLDDFM